MDADKRQIVTSLFAEACFLLHQAEEAAIEGQSAKITAKDYRRWTRKLENASAHAHMLARAIAVVLAR